jgi:hypothetical protein
MKYICLGYFDKSRREGMTEGEQHAMFDTCFVYDDHLRANGYFAGGEELQPPETPSTLYWKNGKVATTDGSICGNQGATRRDSRSRGARHQSRRPVHGTASGTKVRKHFRDSASGGLERTDEGK